MSSEQAAPPPVRFDCPACGATLTVPATAAGLQGPCPKCWQEIVSPDPGRGLAARLAAPPPPAPPPEPEPEPRAQAPGIPEETLPRSSLWFPCLLTALVFASAGYFAGKTRRPLPAGPIAATPATPEPAPPPVPPDPGIADAPQPPPISGHPEPQAALRAFLEAPDLESRVARVLSPDEVRPAMEKHAAEHGGGPIATSAVQLLEVAGPNHIFKVCTPAIPEGFPVAVTRTDEGPMIDWESFIGFHDDHFRKFIEGPADRSGIFDLLVKPEPAEPGDAGAHFVRYRLSVPMPNRETVAWIRKDAVGLARLRAIFDGSGGLDQATIGRLAETGVPLVLALVKRKTNDGRSFVEIEDFVAVGWGPAGP